MTTSALARRTPKAHFPRGGSGSFPVIFVCCGPVRRFETAESGLDGSKPSFGHEIAVRRYRPVRKFGRLVFGFFDKCAAHAGYRSRIGLRRLLARAALASAASLLAGGFAAILRLNASIRLMTFLREGATGAGGAGVFACFFLRMRTSAFV